MGEKEPQPDNDIPGPDLSREEQIELLKSGVREWNAWRKGPPYRFSRYTAIS